MKLTGIKAPYVSHKVKHVFHQFTVRVEKSNRNKLMEYLNE